jgi:serine/threonine protein kinase
VAQALVFFSDQQGNPRGLSSRIHRIIAPRGRDPLPASASLWPRLLLSRERTLASRLPKLHLGHLLSKGSTAHVFSGIWLGRDVAVKVSCDDDARLRLATEAMHYSFLHEQSALLQRLKTALPEYIGYFSGHAFDLLVLSVAGQRIEAGSWSSFTGDQRYLLHFNLILTLMYDRYSLFTKLRTIHSAGLVHGDVHPRNVAVGDNGCIRLLDLSEASHHHCPDLHRTDLVRLDCKR